MKSLLPPTVLFLAIASASIATAQSSVVESEREIPIAYEADIVVVGGTTGAVASAIAAAEDGASVFLAAPRPYLGEDVCGTLRLWLEPDEQPSTALEHKLFDAPPSTTLWANRLPLKYQADQPSDRIHRDTQPGTKLTDGKSASAANESVQFNQDVTIIADLSGNKRVKELHLLVYQRSGEFEVAEMEVWTSPNGKLWRTLGTVKNPMLDSGISENSPIDLTIPVKQLCSFVKVTVRKTDRAQRLLLGELVIVEDRPAAKRTEKRLPPTPMQVKYALDQALIDAGVRFLYGSPVTDVLHDRNGRVSGVVIANRAGRQAVKAKVVIDGSMHAQTARIAGVEFDSISDPQQTFQRIVVGGEARAADGLVLQKPDVQFSSPEGIHDVFVYQMNLPVTEDRWKTRVDAEQTLRDVTFDAALVDESDVVFQLPASAMVSLSETTTTASSLESIDLDACRAKSSPNLFVLGGAIDVPRELVSRLMRPLSLMRLGTRIGKAASELSRTISPPGKLAVSGRLDDNSYRFVQVKEFLQGTRPTDQDLPTVHSPERSLPVLASYDVVVVGGGTGGAPAAISSGRRGSSTLLIEYQDHLGGVGTLGLISSYYHGYRKGYTSEVDRGVAEMGGPKRKGGWNPVTKREYWRREVRRAGCDIWFSTLGVGTLVSGDFVKGVVVATPEGRGVVMAKVVIDATGNADIAAAGGAETITTSANHVAMQGTGLSPRALGTGYTNTDYSFSDESDPVDQWRMIVSARRKYKNSYDISPFIDSRERRRIIGEVFITPLDLMNGRSYHDTIAMHQSNFDTHGFTVHPVFLINFPDKKQMTVPVPFRALLPKQLDGILVTGLGISAHRDSMPILRMQACIQNQGYAAGFAASMAAENESSTRSVNLRLLQEHLVEIGSLEPNALDQQDSPPADEQSVAAAVHSVVHDYQGLALILEQSELAIPHLRQALADAANSDHRIIYANILGILGDDTGSTELIKTIENSEWDEGWNFRGMGQFGGSISRLDSHIIALGQSGDKRALQTLLQKLNQLDASKEFSHHRAIAMALESLADRRAAKPLAELLRKPDMMGYAITDINSDVKATGNETRSQPLREIILARALFRCGDHEGLGSQILTTYSNDLRGLFAQHASAVLKERE